MGRWSKVFGIVAVCAFAALGGTAQAGSVSAAGERLAAAGSSLGDVPAATLPAPAAMPGLASAAAETDPCARKVKVVYAGYGEAARASCSMAAAGATR